MGQIEQQPNPTGAKHTRSHHAQNEGGSRIVAEGQQPFRLSPSTLPLLVKLEGGAGSHGVSPHKAHGHRCRAAASHPKQGAHDLLQSPAQISGQTQVHHQGGQDKKGEQGGDDDVAAQGQPIFRPLDGLAGGGH